MPPTLNERLAGVSDDLLRWSALARSVLLRPEQRAMRFDAYGRETPLAEPMLSEQDIDEAMRAQGGGIAVRVLPPGVMYHGSRAGGLRTLQSPRKPIPAWFAEQPSLADAYAWGGAGTVYRPQRPVQLQNPLVLTKDMNTKAKLDDIRKDSGLRFRTPREMDEAYKVKRWEAVTSPEFVEAAKAAGYDGIRVTEGGHTTWGLFAPTPVIPPGVRQQRPLRESAPLPVPKTQMDFWGRGETGGPPPPPPTAPAPEGLYVQGWRVF